MPIQEIPSFLYGLEINPLIIKVCLEREVPTNNLYWKGKTTYLNSEIKYLSIPFWLEICFRSLPTAREEVLTETFFQVMEQILHYSEEEERAYITYERCLHKCCTIPQIKERLDSNPVLHKEMLALIHGYPNYKALRRGNFVLLFALMFSEERAVVMKLAYLLSDLMTCGCILDDLRDIKEDRLQQEDNLILEIGDHRDVLQKSKQLFEEAKNNLSFLSENFAKFLDKSFIDLSLKYVMNYHLNNL